MNEVGNTVVHAPSDHGLQIISPATTTITSSNTFIDLEDTSMLTEADSQDELNYEEKIDQELQNYSSFLEN